MNKLYHNKNMPSGLETPFRAGYPLNRAFLKAVCLKGGSYGLGICFQFSCIVTCDV